MKLFAVASFDEKLGMFASPFFANTLGQAERFLDDLVKDEQSPYYKHPGDFVFYHLGMYDTEAGTFENLPAPVRLISALDIVNASARRAALREVN